ncbi:TonB family protein / TonB-dependent receptor [Minicystis rosea]|nr:TonB family protein / TonB-dependent receptor [Minicystis rosea]
MACALLAFAAAPSSSWAARPSREAEIAPPRPNEPLHAEYPTGAIGEQDVVLEITVDGEGHVENARAVTGPSPFIEAALQASSGWRFEPARQNGKAVRARIRAAIHFTPPSVPEAASEVVAKPTRVESPKASPVPKPLEVVVTGGARAPGATSLSKAEVRVLPGAFGDPFRAIEAMPGVTPVFSGLPYFYVRGAPPGNVGYFLDGIRVPALYHLLAGPAVVPGSLIQRVDLFPGGYPAEHGRFTGGIVAGETRPPASDFHAEGALRLVDAGALVEAPLPGGLGSALAGARYSYSTPVVSLFVPDFKLNYWDYQGRVALNLSSHDRLTLFAFGAHDYSARRQQGVWEPVFATEFHRVDLRYDAKMGERTTVQHGVTFGRDHSIAGNGSIGAPSVSSSLFAARSRVEHRAADAVLVRAGANVTLDTYATDTTALAAIDRGLFPSREDLSVGLFADAVIDAGRGVQITPGARIDLWGSAGATAISADLRLALRVPVTERVRLIDAVGMAHQPPGFVLQVPGAAIGGLAGGLQRSVQTSAGVEVDLPLEIKGTATFFHNAFFNLSDPMGLIGVGDPDGNPRPIGAINQRVRGSSVGMELYVGRKLTERLGGFVSYTLSRSSRSSSTASFAAQFDRTHVLNAALSWDIGLGFRVGSRVSFYTGMPLTPFYPQSSVAAFGRDRLPPFFRLDARAEKRWVIGGEASSRSSSKCRTPRSPRSRTASIAPTSPRWLASRASSGPSASRASVSRVGCERVARMNDPDEGRNSAPPCDDPLCAPSRARRSCHPSFSPVPAAPHPTWNVGPIRSHPTANASRPRVSPQAWRPAAAAVAAEVPAVARPRARGRAPAAPMGCP